MSQQRPINGKALKGPLRRYKRYLTRSLVIDNPVPGRVVNVGEAGFAVETLDSLTVGATYVFKVRLGDKHLRLPGRIQWCRLTEAEASGNGGAKLAYRAGVALAETVSSRAWQEALRRMTEDPAYLIWHRSRGGSLDTTQASAVTERTPEPPSSQAGL